MLIPTINIDIMSNMISAHNPQWLPLRAAAQTMGVSYSGLCKLLKKQPADFKEKYVCKMRSTGQKQTHISHQGMVVLANMSDAFRGNQFQKVEVSSIKQKPKQKVAERAIANSNQLEDISLKALHKMIGELIQSQQKILQVQEQQEQLSVRIALLEGDTENSPLTSGQRDRINEKVRLLAHRTSFQHSAIWSALHKKVGRRSIKEYRFDDYQAAMKSLRGAFNKKDIPWD